MKHIREIQTTLKNLEEMIKNEYKAELVGLFGSYVREEQKETSDIDILVRFYDGATLFDLTGLANFLEEKLQIPVDIVPVDTVREEIKDYIMKEVVYI